MGYEKTATDRTSNNGPDKPWEDLLTRLRQEILPDSGGLGGQVAELKKGRKMKRYINAYFTVEAAFIVPIVMSTVLFVIYILFYQYNRCLMEQDLGAMALWGSRIEDNGAMLEEKTRERMGEFYWDKYVAWEMTTFNATLGNNSYVVKGAGHLTFPLPRWNFWSKENAWGAKVEYEYRRISPAAFIRLCHRVSKDTANKK